MGVPPEDVVKVKIMSINLFLKCTKQYFLSSDVAVSPASADRIVALIAELRKLMPSK